MQRLRAEIARLRDLLEENGIDPEPYVPPPPQFGPPTRMEWQMAHLFDAANRDMMRRLWEEPRSLAWALQDAKIGTTLRVRLPTDFSVRK